METDQDQMGSVELCEATGMSYRQLDYWVRHNVIPAAEVATGSGSRRTFDPAIIPAIQVLVTVAKAFTSKEVGQLSMSTYADIYDNYERGWVDLAPNVRLSWFPL